MDLEEFKIAQIAGLKETCCRASWGQCWPSTMVTQKWSEGDEIYLTCDHHAPGKATPIDRAPLLPENLENTVSQLRGPGVAKLRSLLSGQFGVRFQSTYEAVQDLVIMQTLDASPENPYEVEFNQHILDPFTGPGQFDLVERDASDLVEYDLQGNKLSGGESEVVIATKSGFSAGITTGTWSHFRKVLTSDKIYSVTFVPGDAGVGVFSIGAQTLYHTEPIPNPEVQ